MHLHLELQNDLSIPNGLLPWYAVRTRSNHEKLVSTILSNKDFTIYLPAYRTRRRWSDRIVEAEVPLFPGYVFCRLDIVRRMPILTTPGVVRILGFGNEPAPIPEDEINAVRAVMLSGRSVESCPFLRDGQLIRVTRGSLAGLEGILVKKRKHWRIVLSVRMLQRSVSVEIDSECISRI